MGVDIDMTVEVRNAAGHWEVCNEKVFPDWDGTLIQNPFIDRNYGTFGWLSDERNNCGVPPLLPEWRGFPPDLSQEVAAEITWQHESFGWGANYATAAEIAAYDFDQVFIEKDSRTYQPLEPTTVREFLGTGVMKHVEILIGLRPNPEDVRIVFWYS